jgi:hypothetical protein
MVSEIESENCRPPRRLADCIPDRTGLISNLASTPVVGAFLWPRCWRCLTSPPSCGGIFRPCANLDHGQRSASYSEPRLGFGCGANTASIIRRSLVRSLSFGGGQTLPATSCVLAHAAPVAAGRVRPFSVPAGRAIISAFIRSRPASPTRCERSIGGRCWAGDPQFCVMQRRAAGGGGGGGGRGRGRGGRGGGGLGLGG